MRAPFAFLDKIKIASPCAASWEAMEGGDQVRFCGSCQLNVYNLSGMTRAQAAELVSRAEGRLCVRFYKRADGTLLTADCPVGLKALRFKLKALAAFAGASLAFLSPFWAERVESWLGVLGNETVLAYDRWFGDGFYREGGGFLGAGGFIDLKQAVEPEAPKDSTTLVRPFTRQG